MFPDDQPDVRSLCLVVHDLGPLHRDDGKAAGDELAALRLAARGWRVHVLYGGDDPGKAVLAPVIERLRKSDIDFSSIHDHFTPGIFAVPSVIPSACLERSEKVRRALERLHASCCFDVIEFGERGGLGFRAIQARRAGIAFHGVRMAVRLHGPSQWQRERDEEWMHGEEDLQVDYCERYSFEEADIQTASRHYLLDYVKSIGWNVREKAVAAPVESNATPLVSVIVPHYNLGAYLPDALESLATQTWPNVEVIVIDDGSTDPASRQVFEEQRQRYPQFLFLTQINSGIGATRNRGLAEANGEHFLCMDADNVAMPHMIERLVTSLQGRPDCSALSCYYLAFKDNDHLRRGHFEYAYRPPGGSHVLGAFRNVYGDANSIYRTDELRAVNGFETDRDTSFEDWELFVKLFNAGHRVDVVPEHLFYYRHLPGGFSRVTNPYRNRQRVLRQFPDMETLPLTERVALWSAVCGFQARLEHERLVAQSLRYRVADKLHGAARCLMRMARRWWHSLTSGKRKLSEAALSQKAEALDSPVEPVTKAP